MDKMKLETVDIDNVQIATLKNWAGKGLDLTEERVDQAIENFNDGVCEPYLSLDHNPGLTKSVKDFFKSMSLGFVKGLRREGKELMADFKQVPKLIGELIDSGALKQRSIEFWKKFPHADGNTVENVLEAVTFHGGNGLPAMNTLGDIPKLFKNYDGSEYEIKSVEHDDLVSVQFKQEEDSMTPEEKQAFDDVKANVIKLTSDLSDANKKIDMKNEPIVDDEKVQMKADLEDQKNKLEEFAKKEEESIKMKTEATQKEAEEFVDGIVKDKKVKPAHRDMEVENYIRFKADGDEKLTLFKESLDSRTEVINLGPMTTGENDEPANDGKVDEDSLQMKLHDSVTMKETGAAYDDIDEQVKIIMKRDKISYAEATDILTGNHKEEVI